MLKLGGRNSVVDRMDYCIDHGLHHNHRKFSQVILIAKYDMFIASVQSATVRLAAAA